MDEFRITLRMAPDVYAGLLNLLKDGLTKQDTNFRPAIPADTRLALTLRYLALGDGFRSCCQQFNVGLSTSRMIVRETCQVIYNMLKDRYLKTPRTRKEWKRIAKVFNMRWNFPHAIGAIDGKHIRIEQPPNSGSTFFNYKGYYSIVLMGIADGDYKFIYVDVGSEGKASDGGIYAKSTFKDYLDHPTNPMDIPHAKSFAGITNPLPYYLVGDDAFALDQHLMKPYPGYGLNHTQRIFNYRLSRSRRIIENVFGVLTSRFRVFRRTIEVAPDFVKDLVLAACVLHNYLRDHAKQDYTPNFAMDREMPDGQVVPGQWRQEAPLDGLMRNPTKNAKTYAKDVRNSLANYFVSQEGALPWQNDII